MACFSTSVLIRGIFVIIQLPQFPLSRISQEYAPCTRLGEAQLEKGTCLVLSCCSCSCSSTSSSIKTSKSACYASSSFSSPKHCPTFLHQHKCLIEERKQKSLVDPIAKEPQLLFLQPLHSHGSCKH